MEKKNLGIIILAVLLTTSGIGNIILGSPSSGFKVPDSKNVLKIACPESSYLEVLDPVDSWYDVANDMIRHVCDTLWIYDLTDPAFPLEMRLAKNYSWNNGIDELTVSLRDDVWFHDGAKFNATAVKFTFDRIMYFINWSGELPRTTHVCDPASLFYNMHGKPILNRTEIIDEYSIRFVLNKPNAILLSLLTYEACSILHPNSVNAKTYLKLGVDILVGTGPFEYIHFIAGEELRFDRWDLYWDSNVFWDRILWEYYSDTTAANNAFLDGEADYLNVPSMEFISTFQAEEDIIVVELNTSPILRYWAINNERVNDTRIRKAMAYAYNYSYFSNDFRQGNAVKANQLIPNGFPYYNTSFKAPYYNTTIARQAMMNVFPNETVGLTAEPFGENSTNDAAWSTLELVTYKVDRSWGGTTGFDMLEALINNMYKIGIAIYYDEWEQFWWRPWIDIYMEYGMWYSGITADYPDPFNMLDPLSNNITSSSPHHTMPNNDYLIYKWLKEYEGTDPTNTTRSAQLLYKIQHRAINELYLLLPLTFDKTYYVHHRSLGDLSYNIMNNLWLADSYYIPGIPIA